MRPRKLTAQTKPLRDDAVCPLCLRGGAGTTIVNNEPIAGVQHRKYYGWCLECHKGHEVIQFKPPGRFSRGRWLIYKYRTFGDTPGMPLPESWKLVCRIPQPVGNLCAASEDHATSDLFDGDGLDGYSDQEIKVIEMIHQNLKKLAQAIDNMAYTFGQLRGLDHE